MTVNELIEKLENLRDAGRGDQVIGMLDDYAEYNDIEIVDETWQDRVMLLPYVEYKG